MCVLNVILSLSNAIEFSENPSFFSLWAVVRWSRSLPSSLTDRVKSPWGAVVWEHIVSSAAPRVPSPVLALWADPVEVWLSMVNIKCTCVSVHTYTHKYLWNYFSNYIINTHIIILVREFGKYGENPKKINKIIHHFTFQRNLCKTLLCFFQLSLYDYTHAACITYILD